MVILIYFVSHKLVPVITVCKLQLIMMIIETYHKSKSWNDKGSVGSMQRSTAEENLD